MASFGGKNPPWARSVSSVPVSNTPMVTNTSIAGQSSLNIGQPGVASVYSLGANQQTTMTMQQQYAAAQTQQQLAAVNQMAQMQPGLGIPTSQVGTVSYPAPRMMTREPTPPQKQRAFTSIVTKLHDNFGFVDEEVFFQTSCVKGVQPKVGDRVLVEATYNPNMPFKWNAVRIQVLPTQNINPPNIKNMMPSQNLSSQPMNQNIITSNPMQQVIGTIPPLMAQTPQPAPGLLRSNQESRSGGGGAGGRAGAGGGRSERIDRGDNHRERRDRGGVRDRREERRPSPRKRSRSPRKRSRSPRPRSPIRTSRRTRVVPRYMVQIPKLSLDSTEANVIALKSRYTNMYVPSDFFNCTFSWTDAFPMHRPFALERHCSFHVMHKDVEPLESNNAVLEPSDSDHLYSAKVMLLSHPPLEELYHKSCALAEDSQDVKDSFQHPARLLNFLVGLKGKSEPIAIGGAWSPSLDGQNPKDNPQVLIKTAIRTTKALTGVDLSSCTQWYRFVDICYLRPEETHKGRLIPSRVETVAIFLPDVWNCNPTQLDWERLQNSYKALLDRPTSSATEPAQEEGSQEDEEEGGEALADGEKKEPTHYSQLDPKMIKVADMRRELEARGVNSKGLKSQLMARLTKALKTEQEKDGNESSDATPEKTGETTAKDDKSKEKDGKTKDDDDEKRKREDEDKRKREEKDRAIKERRYQLPDTPHIIVHPSGTAKNGRFDCTVMSLSVLLDYRPEDTKEHSFEVSLFAELFNEMLMRDAGFRIYKALVVAPEKKEDDKRDGKEKDAGDKRKDSDKESSNKDEKRTEKDEKKVADKKDSENEAAKEGKKSDESKKDDSEEDRSKSEEKPEKNEKESSDVKEPEAKRTKHDDKEDFDEREASDAEGDDSRSTSSRERRSRKDKQKLSTVDPALLLSFVYFDTTHTGYILEKDVEEIIHTLGLHLSRAQVRKLVQKVVIRDTISYRRLTDRPVEKSENTSERSEQTVEKMDVDDKKSDDELLALGNRPILHDMVGSSSTNVVPRSSTRLKKIKTEPQESSVPENNANLISYKGAMVDISSLISKLEKSENIRIELETKLKEAKNDLTVLNSNYALSEESGKKANNELQDLKKQLRDQRKQSETAESNQGKYRSCLEKSREQLLQLAKNIEKTIPSSPPKKSNGDS
ncbi:cell division cycle and apoptosis regulator protein 1-like [Tubulanus polymorphus]|uniref:cell division cycle and apoptosis regulator protein 1-like n=1 Tax=Tubulanus polymorphus TaxID=672921 RepID=UPI003DA37B33